MTLLRSLLLVALLAAAPAPQKPALKDDYASELPRIPPRSPAEALTAFRLRPGFRVERVASEPLIRSPVAAEFDEEGRLYVVEYPEYNQYARPGSTARGCVKRLEDTDGDGTFDKATTYVDNLDSPVAVTCWDGGIFVGSVPNILYCKDTDGDGKADVRRVVFTGFSRDAAGEAMMNSFRWGLDNRIHVSTNLAGGLVHRADDKAGQAVNVRGAGFVFDPRSLTFDLTSGGGQHGMSWDDWGRTYVCDNSNPVHVLMYDARYLARNPYVQAPAPAVNAAPDGKFTKLFRISPNEPWRVLRTRLRSQGLVAGSDEGGQPSGFFTGATGITVYRGDAWPAEYRGNLFVGEVSGNLVYRAKVEPQGLGVVARRADEGVEFLASTDNWFRPVQFLHGPDGCLSVIDMYRELIEGAAFLPPQVLKHLDVSSGIDRGRIYRIVHESSPKRPRPSLGKATTSELVALLQHPNGWHRDTAARLLSQRQDRAAVAPLRKLASESPSALGRMHALYALDSLKALEPADVVRALGDATPHVREHALRLAERHEAAPEVRARLAQLVDDSDPGVRYQLAFTLGSVGGEAPGRLLARLAVRDGANEWVRVAVLSSTAERSGEVFRLLTADRNYRATTHGRALLTALATQIGAANRAPDVAAAVQAIDTLPETERPLAQELVRSLVRRSRAPGRARLAAAGAGKSAALLAALLREARTIAADEKRPAADRAAAVQTLALAPFAEVRDLIAEALAPREPQPVQRAALEVLASFDDRAVPGLVLDAWPGLSPQLRATAAETLFARPAWITAFLDAVEKGKVRVADVDPARVQLLQGSSDRTIRERAARLFASTKLSGRADVVAAYQKVLTIKGDPIKGKIVFKNVCSTCHRLEGVGESVGAELAAIRDRGMEAVLLNILDPNREVLPRYVGYYLETQNGRTITGMITAETANAITLRRADGSSETVLRVDIAELRSTGVSYMPEGLEKQIDVAAMADLLAYLNSVK